MSDLNFMSYCNPINKTAQLVTQPGEGFKFKKNDSQFSSPTPIEVIVFTGLAKDNMTGKRFNKFIVVGYLGRRRKNTYGSWLVKCDCGTYENRTKKALNNNHNDNRNQCHHCDKIDFLRSGEYLKAKELK